MRGVFPAPRGICAQTLELHYKFFTCCFLLEFALLHESVFGGSMVDGAGAFERNVDEIEDFLAPCRTW